MSARPTTIVSAARRGFSPLRDLPAAGWLAAAVLAAAVHPVYAVPRWLLIHLVVLGAVSHSILVWSQHFADTLLHTPVDASTGRRRTVRLVVLNLGAVLVLAGVLAPLWPLVVVGASGVAYAAAWHAFSLARQLRRALASRFALVVRYYVAAAALLPLGALFGTQLATDRTGVPEQRLVVAHVLVNVLGWVGLTVLGTLVTLWPTMLRTRMADGAERAARRALPVLVAGLLVAVASAVAGVLTATAAGVTAYLLGVVLLGRPFVVTLRAKRPSAFSTWSVLAAVTWLVGVVGSVVVLVGTAPTWEEAEERLLWVTPALAAGFAGQILLGALSYLLPVALGGGPRVARATNAAMERGGALRLVLVNGGLLIALLPTGARLSLIGWGLVLAGLAGFLGLVLDVSRVARRAKAAASGGAPLPPQPGAAVSPRATGTDETSGRTRASALGGLVVLALAVSVGVGVGSSSPDAAGTVVPTGRTTQVAVTAEGMRFSPGTVEVPAGNRLVLTVTNADSSLVHDLTLETGRTTGLLDPGGSARLDAGVVGRDLDGWCSVGGHRQMGMVLRIVVTGAATTTAATPAVGSRATGSGDVGSGDVGSGDVGSGDVGSGDATYDPSATPDLDRPAYPAVLPTLGAGRVHRLTLPIEEVEREVAPGVTQRLWTFGGEAPGPTLHGRVGDVFDITLVNHASMSHSIDFHAGQVAPDAVMRTIAPGESLHYRFTATHSGIWLYHCSTAPMSVHIANGMFGAVVIDPPGLAAVDEEYVIVQSELYFGPQGGPVDAAKVAAERPDAVVFNGTARQYDAHPLAARVGDRVRVWVLDAGPNRPTAFHVVGGQFDTVFAEGAYRLRRGNAEDGASQALGLQPAEGGFVELSFLEAGHYPFVSHLMVDAERGAHGVFDVRP